MSLRAEQLAAPCATLWERPLVTVLALTVLAGLAILAGQPLAAIGLFVVVPLGLAMLALPQLLVPAIVFVIYTNAPAVAIRFHHVPTMAAALVPAALALPLAYYLVVERRPLILTGTLPLIGLFALIQSLGIPASLDPDAARDVVQTTVLEGLVLYALVTNVVRTRRHAMQATWALLFAGCAMGGLSLFQQLTGTFDNHYGGFAQVPGLGFEVVGDGVALRQARLCGPVGEQNRYAQIMLMLVPLGLYLYWSSPPGYGKLIAAVATTLSAAGCVLAFSRGAAVGFLIMLLLMAAMRQVPLRHFAVFGLGIGVLLLVSPQYRERLATLRELAEWSTQGHVTGGELDGAIRGRATVMLAAVRVTADYPVLGVGPGMFNLYSRDYGIDGGLRAIEGTREAHSLYLELAAEHGLVGLGCFLALVGVSLINLGRVRRYWQVRDPRLALLATGYTLAVAAYLSTGLFLHFSYARYFWLILALADAVGQIGSRAGEDRAATDADRAGPQATSEELGVSS